MVIKRKRLTRIVGKAVSTGRTSEIPKMVLAAAGDKPEQLISHFSFLQTYFNSDALRDIFVASIDKDYKHLLNNPREARLYFSDDELSTRLSDIHSQHPWDFYNHAEPFSFVFPSSKLIQNLDDKSGMKLFLFYCFDAPLESFSEAAQKKIKEHVDFRVVNASIGPRKESGFACGGMELNYKTAISEGKGYCLVNDVFLAKMFHRKTEAKKVSLISRNNFKSTNNYLVWADVIYAPSNGGEKQIIDAITQGQDKLYIDDLIIRPTRPIIGYSSTDFFNMLDN